MARAKHGDTVKVHYACFLEDGSLVDTTMNGESLKFTIGKGQVIHSFEEAVLGMCEDESKTTKVPMDEAFGPHKEENILVIHRKKIPRHLELEVGEELQMSIDGQKIITTIIDVAESTITLDANHPLAGKNLTFNIRLLEIA